MSTYLFHNARVHTGYDPTASSFAITDGVISWIGTEHGIPQAGRVDRVIDLAGLWVTPAFVDAHVHCTDAGLSLIGLDLSAANSRAECLRNIRDYAAANPTGILWGHGWDETRWAGDRAPSRDEIDEVVGERVAYFSRVDVHSALVSSALLRAGVDPGLDGFDPVGPVRQQAHNVARAYARGSLGHDLRSAAQQAFLDRCAARGIVEVHECAAPDPTGLTDMASLTALDHGVGVRTYLGALVADPVEAAELLQSTKAAALGGDLSVDGALGSHTAALTQPYTDAAGTGVRYLDDDQIRDHLVACAKAGIQPGFHAIGDDAVLAVAQGLLRAAELLGPYSLSGSGTAMLAAVSPRIEHAEMCSEEAIAAFASTGTIASVQPQFDQAWGGPNRMYAQRLGSERALAMNPFAALASAGVSLAFGSDAPVTAADPWVTVRAGINHLSPGSGVSPRAAFVAHTRGGHRAAGRVDRGVGTISVGAPADLAFWSAGELVRPEMDDKVQRWSTDPRSRTPLLPDLSPTAVLPSCVATLASGRAIFDTGVVPEELSRG